MKLRRVGALSVSRTDKYLYMPIYLITQCWSIGGVVPRCSTPGRGGGGDRAPTTELVWTLNRTGCVPPPPSTPQGRGHRTTPPRRGRGEGGCAAVGDPVRVLRRTRHAASSRRPSPQRHRCAAPVAVTNAPGYLPPPSPPPFLPPSPLDPWCVFSGGGGGGGCGVVCRRRHSCGPLRCRGPAGVWGVFRCVPVPQSWVTYGCLLVSVSPDRTGASRRVLARCSP